ncbi:hypothetical protein FA95DRAFT_977142 [Auriscalpium vulgare]|uniref:Uncharacterized protein n=1 Tax=Auriscalpium vulgare TaxID=40419 RepID=A0ACB8RYU0_9AGAM|nr:hypothetical protein FA95DRAFT_977142 [Auriscalpium vulgare]
MHPSPPSLTQDQVDRLWRSYLNTYNIAIDQAWTSYEGRRIDLAALQWTVSGLGGYERVTSAAASDGWAVIGASLGFVHFPAHDAVPAKCAPALAQRLQAVYAKYLVAFDQAYRASWAKHLAECKCAQDGRGTPTPQPTAAQQNVHGAQGMRRPQANGGIGGQLNHPPHAGPSSTPNAVNKAEQPIHDVQRSWAASKNLDVAPTHQISASQKEQYNDTLGRLISQLDELERQLPLYHAFVRNEDTVRKILAISVTARYQSEQLSTANPRFILDMKSVRVLLQQVASANARFKNAMITAREPYIRTVHGAALPTQQPPQSHSPGRVAWRYVENDQYDEEAFVERMLLDDGAVEAY